MAIDLSSLDAGLDLDAPASQGTGTVTVKETVTVSDGKPLELAIDDVYPDPNQPRKEFQEEKLLELAQSIESEGVRSPVSVRQHPEMADKYMLNYGERRLKAAQIAGLRTIPAFIDSTSNTYVQVIENLQREALTAMELANFISARLQMKERKGDIAKQLGIPNDVVTFHSALIDAPEPIVTAYREGKFRSARVAYELRKAFDLHGEAVSEWIADQQEITRKDVVTISKDLKSADAQSAMPTGMTGQGTDPNNSNNQTGADGSGAGQDGSGESPDAGDEGGSSASVLAPANPAHQDTHAPKAMPDPSKIKKPLLIVVHGKRAASVLLTKRPTNPGLLHIKYEDNGEEVEVDAAKCKIDHLMESSNS